LTDGRQSSHSCESHRGDFQQPFSESELREKFRELASAALMPEGVNKVENSIEHCEDWRGLTELTELLRQYGRP
jgi:hypothetical protein